MSDKIKKISKLKVIKDAFTTDIPKGEPWFEARMTACKACPKNSRNASLNAAEKLKQLTGEFCTICGCFDIRKASQKSEECALSEIGEKPKWNRLMVATVGKDDYNFYNNSPQLVSIDFDEVKQKYVVDFGMITSKSFTNVQLLVEGPVPIRSITASCSCTTPGFKELSPGLNEVNIGLKKEKLHPGKISGKNVYIVTEEKKQITIELRGTYTP